MYILLVLLCSWVIADPVVIPPSTNWDGNDGPWSSFTIQIGTPPQAVRVFPSSSGSTVWAVVPAGCTENDPSDCPSLRGGIYDSSASSTWQQKGIYNLPLETEKVWGYSGNGQFGYEQITLSYAGGGGPTLNDTIMGGIASKDFFIGTLGLTPWGVNFTDYNYPIPSILTTLVQSETISTNSWSYTAGAQWTPKQTFGSLIFGGYDSSRFESTDLSFTRGEDISRDLLVGIQSITTGTYGMLQTGIVALIDSTVAHIWLPIEACQRFEEVFGLVWDEDVKLYLVNDTLHESLQSKNPVIIFTLGSTTTSRDIVDIKMPYGAFDLTADWPLTTNGSSKYFPLRRAENSSQYVLGRTFLQSAYLIVDYDRNNFTVAQALYPDTDVLAKIVTIDPISSGKTSRLNVGAVVGIAIGGTAAILSGVGIWCWRRRKSPSKVPSAEYSKPELHGMAISSSSAYMMNQLESSKVDGNRTPAWTTRNTDRRDSEINPAELGGIGRVELSCSATAAELPERPLRQFHEMP